MGVGGTKYCFPLALDFPLFPALLALGQQDHQGRSGILGTQCQLVIEFLNMPGMVAVFFAAHSF